MAASVWTMLVVPAVLGSILLAIGGDEQAKALAVALILQAAAPPVISSPALAALMGLDAALSLATLIVATAATPFTAPALRGVVHRSVDGRFRRSRSA